MGYTIHQDLTTVNLTKGNSGRKYLVIHYTGNVTDTAKANASYFRSTNRGASAHYFVDGNTVYQVVADENTAWAVGNNYGSGNLFGTVTNSNSISIEMCSTGGKISDAIYANTITLTKSLMAKYGIPAYNVYRHYDVCSKSCPGWSGWLGSNPTLWNSFKSQIGSTATSRSVTTTTAKKKGKATMNCFFTPEGRNAVYYFNGIYAVCLGHPDEVVLLNRIYNANNGQDMPSYQWTNTAPWWIRLLPVTTRDKVTSL